MQKQRTWGGNYVRRQSCQRLQLGFLCLWVATMGLGEKIAWLRVPKYRSTPPRLQVSGRAQSLSMPIPKLKTRHKNLLGLAWYLVKALEIQDKNVGLFHVRLGPFGFGYSFIPRWTTGGFNQRIKGLINWGTANLKPSTRHSYACLLIQRVFKTRLNGGGENPSTCSCLD